MKLILLSEKAGKDIKNGKYNKVMLKSLKQLVIFPIMLVKVNLFP